MNEATVGINTSLETQASSLSVLARAGQFLFERKRAWAFAATEPGGLKELFVPYGLLLAALPAVGYLIGSTFFGLIGTLLAGAAGGLLAGVQLIGSLETAVSMFIGAIVLDLMVAKAMALVAPWFGAKADWTLSCRVLVYSSTAPALLGVFGFIPVLGWIAFLVACVHAAFSLYWGLGTVLGARGFRRLFYFLTVTVLYLCSSLALSGVTTAMTRGAVAKSQGPSLTESIFQRVTSQAALSQAEQKELAAELKAASRAAATEAAPSQIPAAKLPGVAEEASE